MACLSHISKSNGAVVLWGAGDLGEIVKYAFDAAGIKVDFFCDSDQRKQNLKKIMRGQKNTPNLYNKSGQTQGASAGLGYAKA